MSRGGAAAPPAPSSRTPRPGQEPASASRRGNTYALVGNPNCGKTTLFNALTGLRQKVGNYPGVTVERKEGTVTLPRDRATVALIDLPGLYSLTPHSPDERIARDVLMGYVEGTPRPDAIINVVDASNLERNLYLTSQLLDLGLPVLIVLTMTDTATRHGVHVDPVALQDALGVPVRAVVASRRTGFDELFDAFSALPAQGMPPARRWLLPAAAERKVEEMAGLLADQHGLPPASAFSEAILLLGLPEDRDHAHVSRWSKGIGEHLIANRNLLISAGIDVALSIAEARYTDVGDVVARALHRTAGQPTSFSDRLDRIFMHRVGGYVIFLALMFFVFQAMFSWATIPQGWIQSGIDHFKNLITGHMPAGDLRDLTVEGIIAGVGNSLVFMPQILLLFFFIAMLEDTGYLARAAFLMDRLMSRVGLHGKSFIPLLSSYACAIPGIMATRTIDSPRARILTILVAPLMSCSARLPVYTVMITAFIPATLLIGFHIGSVPVGITLPALTMFAMYALGTLTAFGVAALFNRTLLKGSPPSFLLEMPPYRLPSLRTVVFQMFERAWLFLKRAGTIILSISIVLWFLASYPKQPAGTSSSVQLRQSFAGDMGRAIEPVIRPLGFDWKMGIGIVSSFAAREVFVTAMGTIYNVDDDTAKDDSKLSVAVGQRMRADIDPRTGRHTFTPLVAICLMVYYVLAMQCISTVAVVRRETNSWKWPLFQIGYMTVLAWVVTFLVYQVGKLMGYG